MDYCGPEGFIEKASAIAGSVVLLDHHKTAKEYLEEMQHKGTTPKNFDSTVVMEKSGAIIALEYFQV